MHCLYESGSNEEAKMTCIFKAEGLEREYWLHRRWETEEPNREPRDSCQPCQPWAIPGAQGLGLLSKVESTAGLWRWGCWSHCGATAAVGTLPKVERRGKPCFSLLPTLQSSPLLASDKHNLQSKEAVRGQPLTPQRRAGEGRVEGV